MGNKHNCVRLVFSATRKIQQMAVSAKNVIVQNKVQVKARSARTSAALVVRASAEHHQTRRTFFGGAAAAATLIAAQPSQAAYGEGAGVFKPNREQKDPDYVTFEGAGYTILVPQRGWNPTKAGGLAMYPNLDMMLEDWNSTDVANVSVSVFPAKGGGLPSPADLSYLLGQDVWSSSATGTADTPTMNEQGFTTGISSANLLTSADKDVAGVKYKTYDILTRTADGSQGGRHHIISVAEKGGKLYVAQVMAGDKHWAVNQAIAYKVRDSFAVA